MDHATERTAEHVSDGHPDKFCDQVADAILDETLRLCQDGDKKRVRTAIECLVKDNLLIVSGEVQWTPEIQQQIDVAEIARSVWKRVGYGGGDEGLTVINHIRSQSPQIASGVDLGGAGDQGIMVGYATGETPEMVPREWLYSRKICQRLKQLREEKNVPWLRSDTKAQVTVNARGEPVRFIVAAQHEDPRECGVSHDEMRQIIYDMVVKPMLGDGIPASLSKINGTGLFIIGGPSGDAGVVGRKIVVDAYGPRVPVGGGAYSGKDPTKVDRSAAYMARHIAKSVVAHEVGGAKEATVHIAYGIGQIQPEMCTAITDRGKDVSDWVKSHFPDLSTGYIIESLGLHNPTGLSGPGGWKYFDTASYGHYGRDIFPWEAIAGG